MVRVAIAGASGYTGFELVRILCAHPSVRVSMISSRQRQGQRIDDFYPALKRHCDLVFQDTDPEKLAASSDLVFTALPHEAAMDIIPGLLDRNVKVVDLSADYRLKDPEVYGKWYSTHKTPGLLAGGCLRAPRAVSRKNPDRPPRCESGLLFDQRYPGRCSASLARSYRSRNDNCRLQIGCLGRRARPVAGSALLRGKRRL